MEGGLGRPQDPSPVGLGLVTEARLAVGGGLQTAVTVRVGGQGGVCRAEGARAVVSCQQFVTERSRGEAGSVSLHSAKRKDVSNLSNSKEGSNPFRTPPSPFRTLPVLISIIPHRHLHPCRCPEVCCPHIQLIPAPSHLRASCWCRTSRERA